MERRTYSDAEREAAMAALAANGDDVPATARQIGVPPKTLRNWANGVSHPEAAKNGTAQKKSLAEALNDVAWKIVGAMPAKVGKASLAQSAVALGVAVDKMRLLRGEATQITDDGLTDAQRTARVTALLDAVRARRDRATPVGAGAAESP